MPYITQTDLAKKVGADRLVELTQDDLDATDADALVAAEAIEYAEGVFNSYARTRYALPVPTTQVVKSVCLNLAIYQLYCRRATFEEGVFKVVKTAHDGAISLLKDIQAGRAALDVPAANETVETPASSDQILTNAARSKFTDSKLSGF